MVLDISNALAEALEKVSAKTHRRPGEILSEVALAPVIAMAKTPNEEKDGLLPVGWTIKDGVPMYLSNGEVVTQEQVEKLLEESGY